PVPRKYGRPLSFSSDGRQMLGAGADGTVQLWDVETGRRLTALTPGGPPDAVSTSLSPDGRRILTTCWNTQTARVWDAATGHPVTPPLQHHGTVRMAAFSPNARWVVTTSGTGPTSDTELRVWSAETGELVTPPFRQRGIAGRAVFSPDSRRLLITGQ